MKKPMEPKISSDALGEKGQKDPLFLWCCVLALLMIPIIVFIYQRMYPYNTASIYEMISGIK